MEVNRVAHVYKVTHIQTHAGANTCTYTHAQTGTFIQNINTGRKGIATNRRYPIMYMFVKK